MAGHTIARARQRNVIGRGRARHAMRIGTVTVLTSNLYRAQRRNVVDVAVAIGALSQGRQPQSPSRISRRRRVWSPRLTTGANRELMEALGSGRG